MAGLGFSIIFRDLLRGVGWADSFSLDVSDSISLDVSDSMLLDVSESLVTSLVVSGSTLVLIVLVIPCPTASVRSG